LTEQKDNKNADRIKRIGRVEKVLCSEKHHILGEIVDRKR